MDQQKEIIMAYINAYNVFDIPKMLKNLHPDIIFENYTAEKRTVAIKGIVDFKEQALKSATLFSERNQSIKKMVENGENNTIEVWIDYRGILAVNMNENLKKGAEITLQGKSFFSFNDQKISKIIDKS